MKLLMALAAGYVIGVKAGSRDLDQLALSLKALTDTDEFGEVVAAARAHVGGTLRELASIVDGEHQLPDLGGDLVSRVRSLVGHT
jgi:hypothetical protein